MFPGVLIRYCCCHSDCCGGGHLFDVEGHEVVVHNVLLVVLLGSPLELLVLQHLAHVLHHKGAPGEVRRVWRGWCGRDWEKVCW